MKTKYDDLRDATDLLLERELEKHRRNLAETARLEAELAQIDGMRRAAQADAGAIGARQMLGADSLWQGWLVNKRAEVLRRSAIARAQESDSLARARKAFSRVEAAETLAREEIAEKRKNRHRAEADEIDALGMLREGRARGLT